MRLPVLWLTGRGLLLLVLLLLVALLRLLLLLLLLLAQQLLDQRLVLLRRLQLRLALQSLLVGIQPLASALPRL
jgi:hypothetical protein